VFVVDGKVVKEFKHLDPEQIEKIDVIKDPESKIAKKYKAQHGVILITTKGNPSSSEKAQLKEVEEGEEVFYIVEDMPSFPGGRAALKTHIYTKLDYPESLKKSGISGEVKVQFTVKVNGELDEIVVASSTHKDFEKPAMKVFKEMPAWSPGKQRGKPVKVKVIVPVVFDADTE
jgi:TonB family protein